MCYGKGAVWSKGIRIYILYSLFNTHSTVLYGNPTRRLSTVTVHGNPYKFCKHLEDSEVFKDMVCDIWLCIQDHSFKTNSKSKTVIYS